MSHFVNALPILLALEGGLVNLPEDHGGITNHGISLHYLQQAVKHDAQLLSKVILDGQAEVDSYDIEHMTEKVATEIYHHEWWHRYHYGRIKDQKLANQVFSISVHIGPKPAAAMLQRACSSLTGKATTTKPSGRLANADFAYINRLDEIQLLQLLHFFCTHVANYYTMLVVKHPEYSKFLHGWLNRLQYLPPASIYRYNA